jgi:signal transduction histidine kinase/CheY-like chemotaxis protein
MLTPVSPAVQLSLYIIAAVIAGFCSLLLFVTGRRDRGMDPLTWWAVSMALTALSLLTAATAPTVFPALRFVSDDVAVELLLLSAGASWIAARAFAGRPPVAPLPAMPLSVVPLPVVPLIGLAGALVWLLAVCIAGFDHTAVVPRALPWVISAAYAVGVVAALRPDGWEALPSRPFFLVLTALYGGIYLVRAVLSVCGFEDTLQQDLATATVVEAQLRVIGISFLALALTKERAELSISRSRDLARDAGEARKRFLAQMSHEVRTPLNGVLGLAQVLLQDSRMLPDQRQHVSALEAAGRHLLAIVNDALDLAKIDAGHLAFRIRPFDPAEAMDACLALVRPAAEDKGIKLQLLLAAALPRTISGDTTRLQQILLNLLWNALKFTHAGGAVTLRVGAGVDWLRCEVIDTGPGIPPEKEAMLFKDFARLDPNAADGTGLGLAISARLAERMGGRLVYHPGPGGVGSLFRLELPWPAVETPRDAPPREDLQEPGEEVRETPRTVTAESRAAPAHEDAAPAEDQAVEDQAADDRAVDDQKILREEVRESLRVVVAESWSAPVHEDAVMAEDQPVEGQKILREEVRESLRVVAAEPRSAPTHEDAAPEPAVPPLAGAEPPCVEPLRIEAARAPAPATYARPAGLNLLVVDDVAANRAMMRALLTSDGHLVITAENGVEAVALVAVDRFDAVLMDVRMPVMDGIEATRRIRKLLGEAGVTPIIAISADVMPETTRTCLAAGMNAMLAKPIERDALVATLRRLELQRYRTPAPRERDPVVPHTIERWALGSG